MWETHKKSSNLTAVSMLKVFQLLMWLKCFHGNRLNIAADKGTSVAPPFHPPSSLPHSSRRQQRQLSSASSPKFALTLGITDPYLGLRCPKRLNTAHGVPGTFLSHTHTGGKKPYLSRHSYLYPHPHPITKGNTAEVSECQQARICLTFAKCHGILGSLHQQEAEWNTGGRGWVCTGDGWCSTWAYHWGGCTSTDTHLWATAGSGEPESDEAPVEGSRPAWCCPVSLEETNTTLLVKHH